MLIKKTLVFLSQKSYVSLNVTPNDETGQFLAIFLSLNLPYGFSISRILKVLIFDSPKSFDFRVFIMTVRKSLECWMKTFIYFSGMLLPLWWMSFCGRNQTFSNDKRGKWTVVLSYYSYYFQLFEKISSLSGNKNEISYGSTVLACNDALHCISSKCWLSDGLVFWYKLFFQVSYKFRLQLKHFCYMSRIFKMETNLNKKKITLFFVPT